jgi:hypothetical protein
MEALVCSEGCLFPILRVDGNLVETSIVIESRKVCHTSDLEKYIVGNWILIGFCDVVDLAVVDTKPILPFRTNQDGR